MECEAPASPLTQTGDEGKVSLFAEPESFIKSSTQPDTDMRMAAKTLMPHIGFLFLFGTKFSHFVQLNQFGLQFSCVKPLKVLFEA